VPQTTSPDGVRTIQDCLEQNAKELGDGEALVFANTGMRLLL